jgi:hypothetical protein
MEIIVDYSVSVKYSWTGLPSPFRPQECASKLAFNKLENIVEFVKLISNKNVTDSKKTGASDIIKSLKEYIKRCAVYEKK